jgi:hypothetical protein
VHVERDLLWRVVTEVGLLAAHLARVGLLLPRPGFAESLGPELCAAAASAARGRVGGGRRARDGSR